MACILLWSSAVRVHDSQAYRKMDVTRQRISRILVVSAVGHDLALGSQHRKEQDHHHDLLSGLHVKLS